jgi:hypothetical protein
MTALDRLRHLARTAIYEPDRGIPAEGPCPEPIREESREYPVRVNGARFFGTCDEHGELAAFGLVEPGGDVKAIAWTLTERAFFPNTSTDAPPSRLRELARRAVYEPDRGLGGDPPEPYRGEARASRVRVNGCRMFLATDDAGELCGIGLMEPGGNLETIAAALLARMDEPRVRPRLQVV